MSRSSLGFKEFLFHYVRTIIPMFALQTRAAHLLFDCPPDTLRCALTASQLSLGGTQNKERHPSDASPYYIRMRMRTITTLFQACGGRICIATGRSPERQRKRWVPANFNLWGEEEVRLPFAKRVSRVVTSHFRRGNCFATEAKRTSPLR